METLHIYVDGSYYPSSGAAGVGIIIVNKQRNRTHAICHAVDAMSANHAELLAAMIALRYLKKSYRIELHSDSQWFIDRATDRIKRRDYGRTWQAYFDHARKHRVNPIQVSRQSEYLTYAHDLSQNASRGGDIVFLRNKR